MKISTCPAGELSQTTNQSHYRRHGGGVGPKGKWIRRPPEGGAAVLDTMPILANSCKFAIHPSRGSTPPVGCLGSFFLFWPQDASKMAQKINFLQTCFSHRLGFALGRVHDGFGAQHGPNLGRFWNHVGAILDHFWVLFWLLNLRPL